MSFEICRLSTDSLRKNPRSPSTVDKLCTVVLWISFGDLEPKKTQKERAIQSPRQSKIAHVLHHTGLEETVENLERWFVLKDHGNALEVSKGSCVQRKAHNRKNSRKEAIVFACKQLPFILIVIHLKMERQLLNGLSI